MTAAEIKENIAQLVLSQKETDRQMKKANQEVTQQLKELGKQIGGLGNKFGTFTEGLAYASISKILQEDFGIEGCISPSVKVKKNGREEEYDILAYNNGEINRAMIVEIKSKLTARDITQIQRKMDEVFEWLPEHRGKSFYCMVAYVSCPTDIQKEILENGWYLARVGEELFEMETPIGFIPKKYEVAG